MTYIEDYLTAAELTWYARSVPSPDGLFLERFLPNKPIANLEAEIGEFEKTNRAAKFRAWDTPPQQGRRDTFESRKVKIPPLGQQLMVGEQEQLQLALARTGGNDRAAMLEAIYNDTDNNVRSIYNRAEIARGDVLEDGKFTLTDEEGLTGMEADFGMPEDNDVAPSGALWNDADDGTPLSNLRTWVKQYEDINGFRPGWAVMSGTVISDLTGSEEVRQDLSYGGGILKPFASDQELADVFRRYRFPTIVPYDTIIEWDRGVNRRVIADNKVIFLPPNPAQLGFTAWGITAEALALLNSPNPQISFQQAPGIVGVTTREGTPPRVHTYAGATCMPMLTNPRTLMVATVR